jgi:hypothetical protein
MSASWTTYFVGPIYTLLPRRWRVGRLRGSEQFLARAAIISGIIESFVAMCALRTWYLAFFGFLGDKYTWYFFNSDQGTLYTWDAVTQAGFITFITLPLTWLIFYFFLEGVVRIVAAVVTTEVYGTFPLFALAWLFGLRKRWRALPLLPLVKDEILRGDAKCDIRISSCRERPEWRYPYTIRYERAYFQVISSKHTLIGARPYVYSFRRLPPGEIARGLRDYSPEDVLSPQPRLASLG